MLCRPTLTGSYGAVIEFIRQCVGAGIETTATVVDLPKWTRTHRPVW